MKKIRNVVSLPLYGLCLSLAPTLWLTLLKIEKEDVPGLLAVLRPSNLFQSLGIESKNETLALVGVNCHVDGAAILPPTSSATTPQPAQSALVLSIFVSKFSSQFLSVNVKMC